MIHDHRGDASGYPNSEQENPCILSGTSDTAMPLGVAIAKTEKAVFGPRHRSKLIETMSFGAGAMKFRKDKRCTAWICSDPDGAQYGLTSSEGICGRT